MGTYLASVAGFGVVIDFEKSYPMQTYIQFSCNHPERAGLKFCPTCGERVSEQKVSERPFPDSLSDIDHMIDKPRSFSIEKVGYETQVYFVGWTHRVGREDVGENLTPIIHPPLDKIKAIVDELVEDIRKFVEVQDDVKLPEVLVGADNFGFVHVMTAG